MANLKELLNLSTDLDEKSTMLLLKAIKNSNQDGFDYLEFLVSIDKLKKMDMDEETAMKSAFSTASSFGLSREKLISSGGYYISVLRREYDAFKEALSRQIEAKIQSPEAHIKKVQKEYDGIDKQIEDLKRKKELYEKEIVKTSDKLKKVKADLKERELKFNDTYNAIKSSIESHIEKIKESI
jgi:chromosome segregation ATPase